MVGFPPKSSILIGFSIINHPFWGTTILGNPYIYIYIYIGLRFEIFPEAPKPTTRLEVQRHEESERLVEMSLGEGDFLQSFFLGGTIPKTNSLPLKIGLLPLNGRFIDPNHWFSGALGQGKITIPCMKLILGGSNFMQQMSMYDYFVGAILRTFAKNPVHCLDFVIAMTLCFVGKMSPLQNTQLKICFSPFSRRVKWICSQESLYLRFPSLELPAQLPKNRFFFVV